MSGIENLRRGDWVALFAQVVDPDPHPEDVTLDLWSHNEQYRALVRRDRIALVDPPDWAEDCTSLYDQGNGTLVRCGLHAGHDEAHVRGAQMWNDLGEYGRVDR